MAPGRGQLWRDRQPGQLGLHRDRRPRHLQRAPAAGARGAIYIPGNFLADPGDGSNPGGWGLGADGLAVEAYLAAWSVADLADIAAIVWPWFESDSTREYGEGAFWQAGAQNFLLALVRGMLGRSAASLPLAWWDPIAFSVVARHPDDPQRDAGDVAAAGSERGVRDAPDGR